MANTDPLPYPSLLDAYKGLPPLSDEKAADGKALLNEQTGILSPAYEKFVEPLDNGIRGGLYNPSAPPTMKAHSLRKITATCTFTISRRTKSS